MHCAIYHHRLYDYDDDGGRLYGSGHYGCCCCGDGGQRFSLLLFFIGKRGKRGPPALTSPSAVLTHSLSIDTRTRSLLCSQTEEGGKHTFQAHRQSLNSRKRRKDVRPRPLWFGKDGKRETRPYQSGFVLVGSLFPLVKKGLNSCYGFFPVCLLFFFICDVLYQSIFPS